METLVIGLSQLFAESSVVGCTDDRIVFPKLAIMERLPSTVRHAGEVGDDDMDVALGVEGPARVMREHSVDEITGSHRFARLCSLIGSPFSKLLLDPGHCFADGAPVGC